MTTTEPHQLNVVKLYNLLLDENGQYHLTIFDKSKSAFVALDSGLDAFSLCRLLNREDQNYYKVKK